MTRRSCPVLQASFAHSAASWSQPSLKGLHPSHLVTRPACGSAPPKHNEEVQLCAFDVVALDGDDLRPLPLSMRKANLARLLARRPDGSSSTRLSKGRSARICFGKLVSLDSRAWCRSIATGRIRADGPSIGSRSRTDSITLLIDSKRCIDKKDGCCRSAERGMATRSTRFR